MENLTFPQVSSELNKTILHGLDEIENQDSESPITRNRTETFFDGEKLNFNLRVVVLVFLLIIFTVGVIGNIMVTMVIGYSRDMKTSTNIFLVNLSICDLLVLLICTPTALIEVFHHPSRWVLGFYLCKFVPICEQVVANASILTILAISFERYYAICRPLRANYICTKSRAAYISVAAWVISIFITSPMILMISYKEGTNEYGEWTARCDVSAGTFWPDTYTITTIILFFLLPFLILLVIYFMIANRLTMDRSSLNAKNENLKARKQVVSMLFYVVLTFFLCLLPFRVITLFVILEDSSVMLSYADAYNNFVYFSRIMVYLNRSSKFRNGFLRLCNRKRRPSTLTRHGTFLTNTTCTASTVNFGHQQLSLSCNGQGAISSKVNRTSTSRKSEGNRGDGKILKNYLLSQSHSHSRKSSIKSQRSQGYLVSGSNLYPFQESLNTSNDKIVKSIGSSTHALSGGKSINNNASNFSGSTKIKSDSIYSAYIPGRRSETVL